jgi:hypothetical protein
MLCATKEDRRMKTFADFKREVSNYHEKYRHPSRAPLTVSGLYDLAPGRSPHPPTEPAEWTWPSGEWPNAWKAGVYVVMADDLTVLYVGKASLASTIGSRLGSYFKEGDAKEARIPPDHRWSRNPRFVASIPVPEPFEAPSLEEYLITALQPSDNIRGKIPGS